VNTFSAELTACAVVLVSAEVTITTGALKFLAIDILLSNSNAIPSPKNHFLQLLQNRWPLQAL
jgi:hypothetical protein